MIGILRMIHNFLQCLYCVNAIIIESQDTPIQALSGRVGQNKRKECGRQCRRRGATTIGKDKGTDMFRKGGTLTILGGTVQTGGVIHWIIIVVAVLITTVIVDVVGIGETIRDARS